MLQESTALHNILGILENLLEVRPDIAETVRVSSVFR